jgi:hypothetical protein
MSYPFDMPKGWEVIPATAQAYIKDDYRIEYFYSNCGYTLFVNETQVGYYRTVKHALAVIDAISNNAPILYNGEMVNRESKELIGDNN